jgi:hypothetical protein
VRVALVHAQFETIHPFLDGNGRIGRLLIAALMEELGLLPKPLKYEASATGPTSTCWGADDVDAPKHRATPRHLTRLRHIANRLL